MRGAATALLAIGILSVPHCGGHPELVRAPESACDGGACPMPDAGAKHAGSAPAEPDDALAPPPEFGAVVVTMKTADGVVHAILCGGEVSSDLGQPTPVACPYDHDGDAGRTLLKLDRAEGLTR